LTNKVVYELVLREKITYERNALFMCCISDGCF
jgi:hypothetical protein